MSNPSGTSIDENGPAATGARAAPKRKAAPRKPKIDADAPRANRSRAVAELLPAIGGAAFRRFGFVPEQFHEALRRSGAVVAGGFLIPPEQYASYAAALGGLGCSTVVYKDESALAQPRPLAEGARALGLKVVRVGRPEKVEPIA